MQFFVLLFFLISEIKELQNKGTSEQSSKISLQLKIKYSCFSHFKESHPRGVVVRGAGCYTKGPRLESWVIIIYTLLRTSMCFDVQKQYRHEVENFSLLRKIKKNPTFHGHESLMI